MKQLFLAITFFLIPQFFSLGIAEEIYSKPNSSVSSRRVKHKWELVVETDAGSDYIDVDNIERDGNRVIIWTLVSYRVPQKEFMNIRSTIAREIYYCNDGNYNMLKLSGFSNKMGTGKLLVPMFDMNLKEREIIVPESPAAFKIKYLCKK